MADVSFVGDLSGQSNGRAIKVTPTATAGETLHTYSGAGEDYLTIWAVQSTAAPVLLTLEWGGVTDPDDLIEFWVPATGTGPVPVVIKRALGAGTVAAFAATADVVTVWGEVWNAS